MKYNRIAETLIASVQDGYFTLMMAGRSLFNFITLLFLSIGVWFSMNIHFSVNFAFDINVSLSIAATAILAYEHSSLTSS